MGLNIKNAEAEELIRELAAALEVGLTDAVIIAVREQLQRVRSKRRGMAERLMAIAHDAGPRFKEPYRSIDPGDLLYNEKGLPK